MSVTSSTDAARTAASYAIAARPPHVIRATPSSCRSLGAGTPSPAITFIGPSIRRASSGIEAGGHRIG